MTTLADYGGGVDRDEPEWTDDVADHSLTGSLIDCGGDACERLKLLQCPACGAQFYRHWREAQNDPLATHLETVHGPADFGLSERGER
ncbi:hypothetical protein D3D02_13230 [Halobellus sp. Atlit-38R]|uniref:hypothetical protein n=1 Tax=Halobellus sp. Atlit-38R TaxID=2282131 RepID=UPI000EF1E21A|nr:hypothetical protein [Halobellus sp. Atlit-38R]RLM88168.1 hypothetical protein D3D02_13230 [Halobellus sp. Atlit-38R]